MLRHRRPTHRLPFRELAHGHGSRAQRLEDVSTRGIGQGRQYICVSHNLRLRGFASSVKGALASVSARVPALGQRERASHNVDTLSRERVAKARLLRPLQYHDPSRNDARARDQVGPIR